MSGLRDHTISEVTHGVEQFAGVDGSSLDGITFAETPPRGGPLSRAGADDGNYVRCRQ
jgi:hypothetical protein